MCEHSEEQIELYFKLYDLDGSDTLDRNEIMHMLLFTQSKVRHYVCTPCGCVCGCNTTQQHVCMRAALSCLATHPTLTHMSSPTHNPPGGP